MQYAWYERLELLLLLIGAGYAAYLGATRSRK